MIELFEHIKAATKAYILKIAILIALSILLQLLKIYNIYLYIASILLSDLCGGYIATNYRNYKDMSINLSYIFLNILILTLSRFILKSSDNNLTYLIFFSSIIFSIFGGLIAIKYNKKAH